MSTELERRLEGLLAAAPDPDAGAGEEALGRALSALRPVASRRRGLRVSIVAFATVLVLLAVTAASLAAAGALHVTFDPRPKQRSASAQLSVPTGASGIAAIVDGRISAVTRDGFRLQGLPAAAVALSPHALYIAAGIGHSLVAMAPDGRRAWSHRVGGTVGAIAWAPDGLRIAYVVRAGRNPALHVIWGNGTHDKTIDRSVRAVRPSWRADSLALAYVGAGGKAIVYDLGHAAHTVAASGTPVTHVAFAPSGADLAIATPDSVEVAGGPRIAPCSSVGVGWLAGRIASACQTRSSRALVAGHDLSGRVISFDSEGGRLVLVVAAPDEVRIVISDPGRSSALHTVGRLPPHATVSDLQVG